MWLIWEIGRNKAWGGEGGTESRAYGERILVEKGLSFPN